jgi:hypothetical protein
MRQAKVNEIMMGHRQFDQSRRERGAALLIAIFALLLISVVAIALIVSSGTDSALASNYRTSTGAYYAALAGLEEGRGRLLSKNQDFINKTVANFVPSGPGTLDVHQVLYIVNPVGGEAIVPNDPSNPYADNEYGTEFTWGLGGATIQGSVNSDSQTGPYPGPFFKWVRINPVTEFSMGDVDVDGLSAHDKVTPLFYDGTGLNRTNTGNQAFEITALAVLPNGAKKMLQYVVAPPLILSFPAALVLDGNTPQFTASPSPSFWVKGSDQGSVGSCNPGPTPVAAVGYTAGALSNFVQPTNATGIPTGLNGQYTNGVAANPDVAPVTLSPNLQTVAGLNSLVQTIEQNADVVVNHNATQADLPAGMSPTNPMTVVINGDLTLSSWRSTGYGLLLVTGKFTYDPDASWNGIILLIGEGSMYSHQGAYTTTQIQGTVFLARTVDVSGNPLLQSSSPIFTPLSSASPSGFDFATTPNTLTNGIYYSSCWIQASMPAPGYKVLSFREILLTN